MSATYTIGEVQLGELNEVFKWYREHNTEHQSQSGKSHLPLGMKRMFQEYLAASFNIQDIKFKLDQDQPARGATTDENQDNESITTLVEYDSQLEGATTDENQDNESITALVEYDSQLEGATTDEDQDNESITTLVEYDSQLEGATTDGNQDNTLTTILVTLNTILVEYASQLEGAATDGDQDEELTTDLVEYELRLMFPEGDHLNGPQSKTAITRHYKGRKYNNTRSHTSGVRWYHLTETLFDPDSTGKVQVKIEYDPCGVGGCFPFQSFAYTGALQDKVEITSNGLEPWSYMYTDTHGKKVNRKEEIPSEIRSSMEDLEYRYQTILQSIRADAQRREEDRRSSQAILQSRRVASQWRQEDRSCG